jgi:hypothetical protein
MMVPYERVMLKLLAESRLDTLARQVVGYIIAVCKLSSGRLNQRGSLGVKKSIPRKEGPIELRLYVKLVKSRTDAVNVSGSWSENERVLQISITVGSSEGILLGEHLSLIQQKCYDTVRHELEHSTQSAEMLSGAKVVNRALGPTENIWSDPTAVEAYFTSPAEVAAYVAGIYHAAKRLRIPFIEHVDSLLWNYVKLAKKAGADMQAMKQVIRNVRERWVAYAQQRFPRAIMDA